MLSILFYLVFLIYTLVCFVLLSVVFVLTVAFDRRRVVLHRLSRLWALGYFRIVPTWRLKVEGFERIDRRGLYVVVVNHRSMLDILLMYAVPLDFKWVAKREVYRWPVFGWVLWMHGDIAIDRGSAMAVKKMMDDGQRWMSKNVSVVIFPEGTRGKGDGVGKFKDGAFVMAKNSNAGILPCAALGTDTAFRGWKINFGNTFRVRALDVVRPEQVQAADARTMAAAAQAAISAEYDDMKREMNNKRQ